MGKIVVDLKNGNKQVHIVWEGWTLSSDGDDFQEQLIELMFAMGFPNANLLNGYYKRDNSKGHILKRLFK